MSYTQAPNYDFIPCNYALYNQVEVTEFFTKLATGNSNKYK